MESTCSVDSGTLFALILLTLFIASMAGLFSKNKESRRSALVTGLIVSFGGVIIVWISNC